MPRDGTETYILPFPDVVTDTTIESTVYNGFTNDVAQDLNLPRPVSKGGTGATDAAGARTALQAEVAAQVVTNYSSHVFTAGSFYSAAAATGAPTVNAFSGICYLSDANNVVIELRDATTNIRYFRRKAASVWGAFAIDGSTNFVEIAGDTMTGNLIVSAEISSQITSTTGTYKFGSSGTKYLNYDASNFQLVGGGLYLNGAPFVPQLILNNTTGSHKKYFRMGATSEMEIVNSANSSVILTLFDTGSITNSGAINASGTIASIASATTGVFSFGNSGTKFIQYDATNFIINGGAVAVGTGTLGRPGTAGSLTGYVHNLNWTGAVLNAWVDTTNMGAISFTSDYRTKKDISSLPGMWNVVKALRPIKYTQSNYTPEGGAQLFVANDDEQWGFVAHELQETLIESAASGVKDAPDTIQSPNPWTIIAALTKTLQEAMTRIEALEAK